MDLFHAPSGNNESARVQSTESLRKQTWCDLRYIPVFGGLSAELRSHGKLEQRFAVGFAYSKHVKVDWIELRFGITR